jgi:hypothetical protein
VLRGTFVPMEAAAVEVRVPPKPAGTEVGPGERACDLELLSRRDHPSGGTHESRPTCTHDVAHP